MSQLTDNLNTIASIKGDIRDAIQAKGVNMSGVAFSGFASKIGEIQTGGSQKPEEPLVETIATNGTFNFAPQAGYVFSSATITVSVSGGVGPSISSLTDTITSNGSYSYSAPSGYAYDTVSLSVSVPSTSTVTLTQSAYNDLSVKDPDIIYLIYN